MDKPAPAVEATSQAKSAFRGGLDLATSVFMRPDCD
jgi:hypothetical protein